MNLLAKEAAKHLAEVAAGTFLTVIVTQCADAVWARLFDKEAGSEPEKDTECQNKKK